MASYNRVIIVGNLTRDVELRYIPSGTAVTDITLAVNERIKKNDQWIDEANFFDVTMWGRTAEVAAEYLSKGSNVLVEGRLRQEKWEQDGQKRSKVKVICDKMQMLGSKGGGQGGNSSSGNSASSPAPHQRPQAEQQTAQTQPAQGPPPEDEVPF
jgi:single-strand DNA-binding protein